MEVLSPVDRYSLTPTRQIIYPAVALLAIFCIDRFFTPGFVISGLFNFVTMGILSVYLPLKKMVFWAACFTTATVYMFTHLALSQGAHYNSNFTLYTRSIGVVVGAVIIVLLCIQRAEVSRNQCQIIALLKHLPAPFVISDKNGTLLFLSVEAARLLGIPKEQAVGQSYFSLLMNPSHKGASIQHYVSLLDSPKDEASSIDLQLTSRPGTSWRGVLMTVDMPAGRCLITLIAPDEERAASTPADSADAEQVMPEEFVHPVVTQLQH